MINDAELCLKIALSHIDQTRVMQKRLGILPGSPECIDDIIEMLNAPNAAETARVQSTNPMPWGDYSNTDVVIAYHAASKFVVSITKFKDGTITWGPIPMEEWLWPRLRVNRTEQRIAASD